MASAQIRVIAKHDEHRAHEESGGQVSSSTGQVSSSTGQASAVTGENHDSGAIFETGPGRINAVMHVRLSTVLQRMIRHGDYFAELIPGVFGIRCRSSAFLDIHLLLPHDGVSYRTTLIGVDGQPGKWEILEFCEDVDQLEGPALALPGISAEVDMIVLATREIMTPVQLGLEELSDPVSVPEMVERADHDMLEGSDMALEQLVDDGFDEPAEASIND